MRINIYLLIVLIVVATSCAGTKKQKKTSNGQETESYIPGTTAKRTLASSAPVEKPAEIKVTEPEKKVTEVEKKIISDNDKQPNPQKYFVIVGSFRDPANARKQQSVIDREGFKSEILKTEEGLYRISVLATDDINEARNEVRRIWVMFPQYSDTWMLISMTR
jgi:cell division protein FtsN